MSRKEIIFAKPFGNPSGSSSSFGGNPIASASAYAIVKTITEEGLVENSASIGRFMLEKFSEVKERIPIVGDVRGKGLMIGIELVKPGTKEKLNKKYTEMVFNECLKRGLIVMGYNADIRVYPPLIITKEIAEEGINIMEEAFKYVAEQITD
jgi:4-aminobutyrate aminotransferase-like enzyme